MYTLIVKNTKVLYTTVDAISLPSNTGKITFTQQPFDVETSVGGGDINENNCTLVTDIETIPEDFVGCKYIYTIENGFEVNPDYIDPATMEE